MRRTTKDDDTLPRSWTLNRRHPRDDWTKAHLCEDMGEHSTNLHDGDGIAKMMGSLRSDHKINPRGALVELSPEGGIEGHGPERHGHGDLLPRPTVISLRALLSLSGQGAYTD